MSRNERSGSLDWPVSVGRVKVGVTQAGGFHLDDDLTVIRFRNRNLLKAQRGIECMYNGRLHGVRPFSRNENHHPLPWARSTWSAFNGVESDHSDLSAAIENSATA